MSAPLAPADLAQRFDCSAIGATLTVRVRAEVLECYLGATCALTLPRLYGRFQARIDYWHLIWSPVRKPGAFAQ
jgi:hypothetical protein